MTGLVTRSSHRLDGRAKVSGAARYAAEFPLTDLAYGAIVTSSVARGRITGIDVDAALARPGVLAVLTYANAPRLGQVDDADLLVLQTDEVAYRGEVVALVVATGFERARAAADSLRVYYDEQPHDALLTRDHPKLYTPEKVNPAFPSESDVGDVEAALDASDHVVDAWYSTPAEHNNPMEPHATTAVWDGDALTVYDSNQGVWSVKQSLVSLFGLDETNVRVLSDFVGGGFGAKGSARASVVLAPMAARALGRPVKVVLTRQQMFSLVGYRTPTIQHVRIGIDSDGRLQAIDHLAVEQTSTVKEFAEQTAVGTRFMYAAPSIRTGHRLAALDVPTPRWMRAPGEAPGSFALESALDEAARAAGIDPVELRVLNDPARDAENDLPFTSRNLVACLRQGAERFGWSGFAAHRDGRWLVGRGVASSTYPARTQPSTATIIGYANGRFTVRIAASDIGTGARTVLAQIAAETLDVDIAEVDMEIADSDFGQAMIAGGSMGTTSWSLAVARAAQQWRAQLDAQGGTVPAEGIEVHVDTAKEVQAMAPASRHSFGAQFVEVRVDTSSGEIRVPRMVGVFAAGRIVNPVTARSQLIGGMTWGLSMALHEESVMDAAFGDYVNHDFAGYHIAANADVGEIDVSWVEEHDETVNPMGIKGIGEIGIVGTAAAIANAVFDATGLRVRDLPLRLDRLTGVLGR